MLALAPFSLAASLPTSHAPRREPEADALDRAVEAHHAAPHSREGEALGEFPLRFVSRAAERSAREPVGPATADVETLAGLLAELTRRRVRLFESSRGLRVGHAHLHPDLVGPVHARADALRVWLALGGLALRAPAPFDAPEWDDEVRLQAAWFAHAFEPTDLPVVLRPGEVIADVSLFRAGIAGRLAAGPEAPSAPRLRADLGDLFERFALSRDEPAAAEWPRRLAA